MSNQTTIGGDRQTLHNGDRVYTYDWDGSRVYGTLLKNDDYPDVSEWFIQYDDGEDYAVLDISIVFKA